MQEFLDHLQRRGVPESDVQIIVSGFIGLEPVIVSVNSMEVREHPCFASIGSGAPVADAMLRWRKPHPFMDLAEILYYVYEAKRFGEISPFVGKDCTILVQSCHPMSCKIDQLQKDGYRYLESQFEKFGPQKFEPIERFPSIDFY